MKILALALTCLLAFSQPADAAPIAAVMAAMGAAFTTAITVKAIAMAALRFLVSTGVSLLMRKFQQRKQRSPGLQTSHTTSGGTDPQGTVFGLYATAGHLVYRGGHGGNNRYLVHVIELGDLPGAGLNRVIIDGEYSELGDTPHAEFGAPLVAKYDGAGNDRAWVKFYDGHQLAADPYLVDRFGADPERAWSDSHILTGLCYVILTFDRLDRMFPNGKPQCRFELNGPGFYDPRKDTSNGGSGLHRWGDPATWEPSRNAMVIAHAILRGITLPCGSIWGGNYPAEDLPTAQWMQAMNDCDLGIGNTLRAQFEAGFEIRFEDTPADILQELLASANAEIFELGGYWYPQVGAPAAPVLEIGDDDLLISEAWQFNPFPGVEKTFNAVTITHPSPGALWNPATLETLINPAWEIEDGGQRLFELRLPMVASPEQGRQIGQSLLADNRRFRNHRAPLPPDYFHLQPLQTIRWTSQWNGYDAKLFQISEVAYDLRSLAISVALQERDGADFAPDLALELPDVARVSGAIVAVDAGVPGFGVSGVSVSDGAGVERRVEITAIWSTELVGTADGLTFEARIAGATVASLAASTTDLSAGRFPLTPVLPGQSYEVRAKAIAPSRNPQWTIWLPVLTPNILLAPADLSNETWEAIAQDARAEASGLLDAFDISTILPILANLAQVDRTLELRDVQQRSVSDALGQVSEHVLWLLTSIQGTHSLIRDAGIYPNPDDGTVRIAAFEGLRDAVETRVTSVEINLDAQAASLNLKASTAYVNQVVSDALLDGSQIPLVDDLNLRISAVEINIDGLQAEILLKADTTTVQAMDVRLSSAQVTISALQSSISLKVDQSDFDAMETRVQSAEIEIVALDGPAIRQTVVDSRHLQADMGLAGVTTLRELLDVYESRQAAALDLAYGLSDMRALVGEDRSAMAAMDLALGAEIAGNAGLLEQEKQVRADQTSALSLSQLALEARVSGVENTGTGTATALASLTTRVSTAEGTLTVQSSDLVSLASRIEDAEGNATGQATALANLTTRVSTAEGTLTVQSNDLVSLTSRMNDAEGNATGQATALANLATRVSTAEGTLTVQSSDLVSLTSRINDAEGNATGQATALSGLTTRLSSAEGNIGAQASAFNSLNTTVGNHSTTISEHSQSLDGISAEYALRLDNNGHVAGFVLRSDLGNTNVPTSAATFLVDKFAIVGPGNTGLAPFVVYATPQVINGALVPAGVYMKSVFIHEAQIDTLMIKGRAIVLPEHSYEPGPFNIGATRVPTCSVSIDRSAGIKTKIDVSLFITGSSAVATAMVHVTRQIGANPKVDIRAMPAGFGQNVAFSIEDSDSSGGPAIYRIEVQRVGSLDPGNTGPTATHVSLFATQFKR